MPTENKPAQPLPSLATGHPLNAATWTDFVQRLKHDCVGAGVRDHCTVAAIFTVQARRIDTGYDLDFNSDQACIIDHDGGDLCFSPGEFYENAYECQQASLNASAQEQRECDFTDLCESDQWEILAELDDYTVTGWQERWEIINSHFTKDAAEAFIRRKKHDYGRMRVYVESQYYAWEFEAIKEAILDGTLTYTPKPAVNAHDLVSMEIAG